MFWISVFVVIIIAFLFSRKRKEKPIDFAKNSDYYLKEFPELFNPGNTSSSHDQKEKKPNILINITNNHLHIYPTRDFK